MAHNVGMSSTTTTAKTITVEFVAAEALEGPAILVHETTGAYHTQDNPGRQLAGYDAEAGVTADMTVAEIEAITGLTGLVIVSDDGDVTTFQVA